MSSNADIQKLMNEQQKAKITCSCGHRVLIGNKRDRIICTWCKNHVFKNKEIEFRYRMQESMLKERRK